VEFFVSSTISSILFLLDGRCDAIRLFLGYGRFSRITAAVSLAAADSTFFASLATASSLRSSSCSAFGNALRRAFSAGRPARPPICYGRPH
jgi:hypothetical protein